LIGAQPLVVDIDVDELCAGISKRHGADHVAGRLERHAISRIDQNPCDQIDGLLRAGG
jgi:hypothetical protein